jgi:hypothetical protein
MHMSGIKKAIQASTFLFFACMIPLTSAYASALSNALKDWDPAVIQGSIMEKGSDYLIVMEKKIVLLDSSISGKRITTRIMDERGRKLDRNDLKKGTIVIAKGCLAFDDKTQTDVLLATDIYCIPHVLKPDDVKGNKEFMKPAEPW